MDVETKSKAERVRDWITENPEGTAAECVASLPDIEATTFYNTKAAAKRKLNPQPTKKKPKAAKSPRDMQVLAAPESEPTDFLATMKASHQFVTSIGGREKAKQALANYDKLADVLGK